MPKPKSDDTDIHAGLKQMHRRRMTDGVRRYRPLRELWLGFGRNTHGDREALRNVDRVIASPFRFGSSAEVGRRLGFCLSHARISLTVEHHSGPERVLRPLPRK